MCGIIGVFPGSPINLDCLNHRGPDSLGIYEDSRFVFGHTRLAINDLSKHGYQPAVSEEGNIILVFNGEIYNHRALVKSEYKSDTKSLVNWIEKSGLSNIDLTEIDGMYAFGAYDIVRDEWLIARDVSGIKPLYITISKDRKRFAFASEIKAFYTLDWFHAEPNMSYSDQCEILQFGYNLPRIERISFCGHTVALNLTPTMLSDVYQFCAGQTLLFNQIAGFQLNEFKFDRSDQNSVEVLLGMAVKSQSIADVEIGVQLSGGCDSSLIAYKYAEHCPRLQGFYASVCAPDRCEDEFAYHAAKVLKGVTDFQLHRIEVTQAEISRILKKVVWHMDEPLMRHPNAFGIYLICEYVKKNTAIKVLLTGEGADETFGGYSWHDGCSVGSKFLRSREIFKNSLSNHSRIDEAWTKFKGKTTLESQLNFDQYVYMQPIMNRQDKMSMANSIEARVPFLSRNFMKNKYPTSPGKGGIKLAVEARFGKDFANRSKMGFGIPWDWLADIAPVGKHACNWILPKISVKTAQQQWAKLALCLWEEQYLR